MAVTEPLSVVAMPVESVLDLAPAVDRSVEVRERKVTRIRPRRPDLAQIAAGRIAAAARREELVVQRASLWSELLELAEWRRDLATECRAATRRHQELMEALAAERAPGHERQRARPGRVFHARSTDGGGQQRVASAAR